MSNGAPEASSILVVPSTDTLPAYVAALKRGWSPDTVRPEQVAQDQLQAIADDADAFIAGLTDEQKRGDPVRLPDGTSVPRLPGFHRWIWDGGFCGRIGLRWQPGTSDLPAYVLGHIGFTIVPWKRGRGHAKNALALILPEARRRGLDHVDLTTDCDNAASQRVILSVGGRRIGRVRQPAAFGGSEVLRFRIRL